VPKFHTPSSSDLLAAANEPKVKENIRTAAIVLFFTLKIILSNKELDIY
jgi:hypothetical protein